MSKFLDARFVFQLVLYLGALLLVAGVALAVFGGVSDRWDLAALGLVSVAGSLSCFVVGHIGRILQQISASNAAILTKLGKQ